MSIGSIDGVNASALQQSASAQSPWQNVLSSVSGTLGLSTSALKQQLQSGQSLSSIASSQGVSQQTLLSSIQNALTQNGSSASGSQLQTMASNIANRTPGAGGHHHHHGGGGGGVESLLATDSTDSTDSTDAAGPSAATPTTTDDGGVSFADQLSAATSASSLLSALVDPSSSQDSTTTLANLAGQSDLWQGINTTA
ncbi:MAG TPA: hypothetical protein VMF14_17540 [Solirubrobacteraceae bacterium]|nr:hypothetical protein [Solirubrobacteraceae bacterium]